MPASKFVPQCSDSGLSSPFHIPHRHHQLLRFTQHCSAQDYLHHLLTYHCHIITLLPVQGYITLTMANLPFNIGNLELMNDATPALVPGSDQEKQKKCEINPDLDDCVRGFYNYKLNGGANGVFLAIATLLLIALAAVAGTQRRALVYSVALALGLLSQVAGYAARISCLNDQNNREGFYAQIVFLTIGPAFLAAAIYWETRSIVGYFGKDYSIVPPWTYLLVSCHKCKRICVRAPC